MPAPRSPRVRSRLALLAPLALAAVVAAPVSAQVPTFEEVAGHAFGERITQHHEMVRYLETLAAASPRVALEEQGTSWEGRRLLLAVVTSPENHARLDEIRAVAERLADPRETSAAEAAELARDQPAIVWLGGSIHGFELSGAEGLLRLLEHLTTRDDQATREALERTVVLIDPMLNPDGRDAFAQKNHQNLGRVANPLRADWVNDFDLWHAVQFRTGHYYFDTNRDWFAHTQLETRNRVKTFARWHPQAMVDAHEMGPDTEFFFDPPAEPTGPYFPQLAREWLPRFGRAYARTFDEHGFEYTTRDLFNYFYPGYTSSYGSYRGAVSMLFEQGSSRGLALERSDESVRTLAEAAEHQYLAAWTTVRTAAEGREELLEDYHASFAAAVEDGRRGVRRYLLGPGGDPGLLAEAAALLKRNGIEVRRLEAAAELGQLTDREGAQAPSRRFPAGTPVVEAAQPLNRLVRALLEPQVPVPEDFLREARERAERDENERFYDMTAWSLPLLFDLEAHGSADGRPLATEPWPEEEAGGEAALPEAGYAYLLDGSRAASLAALVHLRRAGHRAVVTVEPTRIEGEVVVTGTVVVRSQERSSGAAGDVGEALAELARRYDLPVRAVSTGRPDDLDLPALGHGEALRVVTPEIAILAEHPVHPYSFGWTWYTLDRRHEIPVTVLRTGSIAGQPLDRFNVLVIPDLIAAPAMGRVLGDGGKERLARWVREGGTLVALGEAVDFVRRDLELIALRSFYPEPEPGKEGEKPKKPDPADEPQRFQVPGAFFRAEVDARSWLAGGTGSALPWLVFSDRVFLEPEGPPQGGRRVVARIAAESPKIAGHAWPESLERLAGAVAVYEERVGAGRVIAFAEDPNFRGSLRGAGRLFLNAVVLGPSAR